MAKIYEVKMISRGNNFPGVSLGQDNLDKLCMMLHGRKTEDEIIDALAISRKS